MCVCLLHVPQQQRSSSSQGQEARAHQAPAGFAPHAVHPGLACAHRRVHGPAHQPLSKSELLQQVWLLGALSAAACQHTEGAPAQPSSGAPAWAPPQPQPPPVEPGACKLGFLNNIAQFCMVWCAFACLSEGSSLSCRHSSSRHAVLQPAEQAHGIYLMNQ